MAVRSAEPSDLRGVHVLVVEDEPIIALDLANILSEAGARVLGPALSLAAAEALLAKRATISCAILDVRIGQKSVFPIARALASRGVPLIFHTGSGEDHSLEKDWPGCRVLVKPSPPETVLSTVADLATRQSP